MKKQIFTFVLGAAAGGSTIAFATIKGASDNPNAEQNFPHAATDYLKKGIGPVNQTISGKKEGSRFIERNPRKTGWESFDLSPTIEWNWNWDHRHYDEIESNASAQNDSDTQQTPTLSRPTATRHLILIRLGQYNLDGKT